MKNIKLFAVNMEDANVAKSLQGAEQSVYEIDSELLERRNESYTRNGLASTTLIGNLVDDPTAMIDPLTKHNQPKPNNGDVDYINDKDYIYFAHFCYETEVYWDQKTNKRHANNNYVGLIFASRGAKYAISHYYKGDGLLLHGYLRSILRENPTDSTRNLNVQYLVVTDFSANPGTHLRRAIRDKFSKQNTPTVKTYNSPEDVLKDRSLSKEQQNKLIAELVRRQYSKESRPEQTTNVDRTSTNEAVNAVQKRVDNIESQSIPQDVPLPSDNEAPKSETADSLNEFEVPDDLSNAFDAEF